MSIEVKGTYHDSQVSDLIDESRLICFTNLEVKIVSEPGGWLAEKEPPCYGSVSWTRTET